MARVEGPILLATTDLYSKRVGIRRCFDGGPGSNTASELNVGPMKRI